MAIRFPEADVRPMGRTAYGVRGITLREDDEVVAMEVVTPGRHRPDRHRERLRQADRARRIPRAVPRRRRVSSTSRRRERNGKVVGIAYVHDEDELMLITQQGKILRMVTRDIRTIGRATQGVRLIDMEDDDRVVSIARLAEREEDLNE